jgi:hypothetical protein
MAKPQAPRKGLTECHFNGTCLPLHCLGGPQQFVEPPMAGRNMLSLGSQVLGRSVLRHGTRLELCGASRGSADSQGYPFHRTAIQTGQVRGAPSTIQYGPVRSESTSLCRGWVETVASASPEPQLRPWSSSVNSMATSSNRGRTRLDHDSRPAAQQPSASTSKYQATDTKFVGSTKSIPHVTPFPPAEASSPPSVSSVCVWPAWKSEGKPASPPTASLLRTMGHW